MTSFRFSPLAAFGLGVGLGIATMYLKYLGRAASAAVTSSPAFFLGVSLTFTSADEKQLFLEQFKTYVDYVSKNERKTTLSYMLMQSDKDDLKVYVLERYADKNDAYLGIHKSTSQFKTFRAALQTQIDSGAVKVEGDSYTELPGMGFV